MKKVSVFIPTYAPNPTWLEQALKSIPKNVDEIVLLAEYGSFGKAMDAVNACGQNVIVHENERFLGFLDSVNYGMKELVTGDFISILPDDDFFHTENAYKIVDFCKFSDVDLVYFPCGHLVENNIMDGLYDANPNVTLEQNLEGNKIFGSSFMSKKMWDFCEGYRGTVCQDWDLFNRALKSGFIFQYLPVLGAYFRYNKNSRLQALANNKGYDFIKQEILSSINSWEKKI